MSTERSRQTSEVFKTSEVSSDDPTQEQAARNYLFLCLGALGVMVHRIALRSAPSGADATIAVSRAAGGPP